MSDDNKQQKDAADAAKNEEWRNVDELKRALVRSRKTEKAVTELGEKLGSIEGTIAKLNEAIAGLGKSPEKKEDKSNALPGGGEPTLKDVMSLLAKQGEDTKTRIEELAKETSGRFAAMTSASSFEKAIMKAGVVDPRQRALLEGAFKAAAPKDVEAWVTEHAQLFAKSDEEDTKADATPPGRRTPPTMGDYNPGQPINTIGDKVPINPFQLTSEQIAGMTDAEMTQHYERFARNTGNRNPFADKALGPLDNSDAGSLLRQAVEAAKSQQ